MPLTRRQIYRRRRIAVFGGAALVLSALVYLPMTLLAPITPAAATVATVEPTPTVAAALDWPGYGAGAIGMVDGDEVLASYGDPGARPMASITKLVLALTLLEAHPLGSDEAGPTVTMTGDDVALANYYFTQFRAKVVPVRSWYQFTERELLELALIESAANYAGSLSHWAWGSDEGFVAAARSWLDAHGLTDITVVEPTGLDPRNTATPAALLELGRLAMANPVVKQITGTPSLTLHDVGLLENTNELLGVDGVTGLKTGTLDVSGSNLLFSVDVPAGDTTVPMIGVVLGGPGPKHTILDADVRTLIATVRGSFHLVPLTVAGAPFADYESEWGQATQAVAASDASIVVWGDTPVTVHVSADKVGTAHSGDDVGEVEFVAGDQRVEVDLVLTHAIEDPGPWWRLTHPALLFG